MVVILFHPQFSKFCCFQKKSHMSVLCDLFWVQWESLAKHDMDCYAGILSLSFATVSQLNHKKSLSEILVKFQIFSVKRLHIWKCLQNIRHFVQASRCFKFPPWCCSLMAAITKDSEAQLCSALCCRPFGIEDLVLIFYWAGDMLFNLFLTCSTVWCSW